MKITAEIDELTSRYKAATFVTDSFADERILGILIEALLEKKQIVVFDVDAWKAFIKNQRDR